jgi:hypothetical protein
MTSARMRANAFDFGFGMAVRFGTWCGLNRPVAEFRFPASGFMFRVSGFRESAQPETPNTKH